MAIFTNISGVHVIVTDELGLPVSFAAGETKSGVSNYLERYTSTYQTGEDVLLRRVGVLDPDVYDGGVPSAVIEEENMAVRPSRNNRATQGVFWGAPGKSNTAITAGYLDLANNAPRLSRIGFDTQADAARRQIDTRYLDIKSGSEIAVRGQHIDAPAVSIAGGTAAIDLDTVSTVLKVNGIRATATDCANTIYGSLLTEGQYYTAFGSIVCLDNGTGTETIGFRLTGINDEAFTTPTTVAWTDLALVVTDANTITMSITGGAGGDTVAATVNFAQDISTSTRANAFYDVDDEIRGWYLIDYNATTAVAGGVLFCSDEGALSIINGAVPSFTAWT